MSLEAFILLSFFVPLVLAAIAGWTQSERIGPWLAAVPTPLLVLLLFVPERIYLMVYGDGTDMGRASGYLAVIFGSVVAILSFGVGVGAGFLKRRLARR